MCNRRLIAAIIVAAPLLPTSGFAQKVIVDTDGSFDFTAHRRYMWREHPLAAKDPIMQEANVAAQVVRSTVNERLMGMGFAPVDENPNFYTTYFVSGNVTEELRVISAIGTGYWYGWAPVYYDAWIKYRVDTKLHGALVLDFVDARTLQLVWRAYCRDTIDDMKKRHENITRAVLKALKDFPPKPAK